MDDAAASQQLMDEKSGRVGAHGDMSLSRLDGMHSSPLQKKRKRSSTQKLAKEGIAMSPVVPRDMPAQSEVPASSPFPFPATQPEPESLAVKDSIHSAAVEVPDSQLPGPPAHATASSPMSSHVIPSSATKSKRTYKQSKQARRDRAISDAMQGLDMDQDAETAMIVDEAASGLHNGVEVASASKTAPLRKAASEAADRTPTSSKRRKIGTPRQPTTLRDLIQDGEDEDAEQPRHVEKSKLKRVKKPQTPIARSKNVYEIPDDDSRPTNGQHENGEARHTSTPKPRSSLKKAKKTKDDVYERATPVHTPGQPLGEVEDEDSIMREPISSDEAKNPGPPFDEDHSDFKVEKKKGKRRSSTKKATPRRESGKYSYKQKPLVGTAAERALEAAHNLQHPPDLRSTGDFTADEEEIIRRAVKDYQQRKGLEVSELVEIIQWNPHDPGFNRGDGTVSRKNDWSPQDIEDARESAEFWDDIKHINTHRSLDRLRRHIRQTYHQFKSGAWTDEEDQRLKNLYGMHPNKWKVISVGMGDRSMYDCQNRWRDYLQYGDKLKTSRWDEEEEELLIRAIHTVAQRDEDHRAEIGLLPIDEYAIKDINWQQVSREMDNTRSRIQVVQKWRNLQKRESPPQIQVEHKPRKEKPNTSGAPQPTPRKRGRPARKEREARKTNPDQSHEIIENSDDDDDGVQALPPPKKVRRPRKSGGTDVNKAKKFRTTETDEIVDNSEEEAPTMKELESLPKKKKRRKLRKSEVAEAEEDEMPRPTETQDVIENLDEEQTHNQQPEVSPPPPKKRGRPRKSEGNEADEDQESHSTKTRDAIVNSDEEDARAEQQFETSPLPKNLGRPPKSDALESNKSNESKDRVEPEVSEESVEDLELEDNHQSEHVEDDAKLVPDTQLDSVQEAADDQPKDGDDAKPNVNGESLDAHDEANAAPVKSPDQAPRENGNQVSVAPVVSPAPSPEVDDTEAQKENEDVLEDDEDEPSVARSNSSSDMEDDQSEKSSEDVLSKQKHELAGEKETEPSVTLTSSDGKKPTVAAAYKMQWGDKFDLIAKLQEHRDEEEGDIDWEGVAEEVATDRPYIWSPQVLQSTLEQLIQLLRDNDKEVDVDDLPGTVDDIMDFISTEHGDQVEEYYDLS